jgi:hypothetical protein
MTTNFQFIPCDFGSKRELLFNKDDQMAYVKYGQGEDKDGSFIQYYCCHESTCPARGRLLDGIFSRTSRKGQQIPRHSHGTDHSHLIAKKQAIAQVKQDVQNEVSKPLRRIFLDKMKR